jgi:mono/diheme cytochrome c family protein
LGLSFPSDSQSTVLLNRDGKQYLIDVGKRTVQELASPSPQISTPTSGSDQHAAAAALFARNCAACHGPEGKGIRGIGTPDFNDPAVQHSISDQGIRDTIREGKAGGRMPAWSGKLTDSQIAELASYIRSFAPSGAGAQTGQLPNEQNKPTVYEPGDDVLVSLPTGRPTDRHGVYVNFAHRFAFDPAFTGTGRGEVLFGLDGFAIPSFGFRYGLTDKLSVSIYRSPSIIGRPIQLMAGYNILDEHKGQPLNMMVRVSIEGQNNFRKNYTENIEGIFSRSITSRAQVYLVPTASFNDRPLVQSGFLSSQIADFPGTNTFSLGVGMAVDIRPTVALLAEVIPTLVNGRELGIHRPAYSFGIQKKIWRHAFTLGLTNSPGTTVSQRAGTRAQFLGDPSADTPGGLFLGFDLTRQIH